MFRKTCLLFVMLCLSVAHPALCQDSSSSVLVSDLLKQIQRGINEAKTTIDQQYKNVPPLDSVVLQLQTETEISGTGGINLWFIKIGGGGGKKSSSQMTMTLKPANVSKSIVANQKLDQTISDALIGVAKGIHDAQIGEGSLPLLVDSLTADFAFTVTKNGTGGLQFALVPIGGSATVSDSRSDLQHITVKFAKPAEKPKS